MTWDKLAATYRAQGVMLDAWEVCLYSFLSPWSWPSKSQQRGAKLWSLFWPSVNIQRYCWDYWPCLKGSLHLMRYLNQIRRLTLKGRRVSIYGQICNLHGAHQARNSYDTYFKGLNPYFIHCLSMSRRKNKICATLTLVIKLQHM